MAVGIAVLTVLGAAATFVLPFDARWSVVGLLAVCVVVQLQLENARGLSKFTKIVPPVDPTTLRS